jgi:hypothetical protein
LLNLKLDRVANKERKIMTRANKKFQKFEGLIRYSNFFEGLIRNLLSNKASKLLTFLFSLDL